MAFLTLAIFPMVMLNKSSNQGSMDAYYEFLAFSLAREPIEIYRGLGYDYLVDILDRGITPVKRYPIGIMQPIDFGNTEKLQYPPEARMFARQIELKKVNKGNTNGVKITVTVAAKGQSKVDVWMSRKAVTLESIIMERPK